MNPRFSILVTLTPWIFYAIGAWMGYPEWGAGAAVVLVFVAVRGAGYRLKLTDRTQLFFFIIIALSTCKPCTAWAAGLRPVLAPALFTLMSLGSLAFGRAFTEEYARERVNPDSWNDPAFGMHFRGVNQILTAVWTMVFAVSWICAAWGLRPVSDAVAWALRAVPIVGFAAAGLLTKFFPVWYRKNFYAAPTHKASS